MPESGNRLAPALEEAAGLLGRAPGSHPQVIVLADAPADVADALAAARRLRDQGITVNVVGVGTETGAPARGAGGFVRDASGAVAITRMAGDALRDIARSGGGMFVPLAQLPALTAALQSRQHGPLDAGEEAGAHIGHWRNEGVWLLPPLLLIAALLARRGWV
jgi:Ca-activated chloride channel family protein